MVNEYTGPPAQELETFLPKDAKNGASKRAKNVVEYATTQSDDERTQKRFIEGRKFISKLRNAAKRMNKECKAQPLKPPIRC